MDEIQTRECPVCGASLEENESFCPFCGHVLAAEGSEATHELNNEVADGALSEAENERFVLEVQEQVKEKTKVWKTVISFAYYLGIVGLIAAYCGFMLNLMKVMDGASDSFGPNGLVYFDLFFVAVFGFLIVCMTLDALELNVIIKTLKESGVDLKRFAKLSYARAEALKPKKCKDFEMWIDQRGSALNIAMFGKFKKTNDETRFCKLAMIAANPEAEEKFRKELWTRQIGFFVAVTLYILTAMLPMPMLSTVLLLVLSIGLIVFAGVLAKMPKARVRLQSEWLNAVEKETETAQTAQGTDEFADFDLNSYDL